MKRWLLIALIGCNSLLLIVGWAMAIVAYPRLPSTILLWVNFFYQSPLRFQKSLAFFAYPIGQLLLFILFFLVARKPKIPHKINNDRLRLRLKQLWQEQAWTALIFFNLILIHLERSLIFLSHGLNEGIHPPYFLILFIFLFFLIPAYRLRTKIELSLFR